MKNIEDDYLDDLAAQHQQDSDKRDFGKEILETMSHKETKDFLTPLLEVRIEKKHILEKRYKSILKIARKHYAPTTFAFNFAVDVIWILKGAKEDIGNRKQLDSLEQYYIWNEGRKPNTAPYQSIPSRRDFTLLIQAAKQVPLERLYKNPLRNSGRNRLKGLCVFHQEKTPSFTIFTDTNIFYCFGCGAQGDSITFYQKLHGGSFLEAVRQLTGTY